MEDAVHAHHAKDDVARVGGNLDDHLAAAVEGAEYLLNLCVLGVFHGDDYLFDVVFGNKARHVGSGAKTRHDGG